jgi:hypothetical protein
VEILAPKNLHDRTLQSDRAKTVNGILDQKKTLPGGNVTSILPNPDDRVYKDDVLFVLELNGHACTKCDANF